MPICESEDPDRPGDDGRSPFEEALQNRICAMRCVVSGVLDCRLAFLRAFDCDCGCSVVFGRHFLGYLRVVANICRMHVA